MATTKGGLAATKKNAAVTSPKKHMMDLIKSMKPQIEAALPSVLTGERFTRMVLSAMSTTPKLIECTPNSFLGAMMQAAQLGVEPNTPLGQAYLIPYKNKGTMECQFQLGYKGLIDLAYRSGQVKDIQAHEVYENDEFEYELGLEAKLRHKPAMKDRGAVVAYYAVFHTKDGGYGFEVMSVDDIRNHAKKYSQSFNSSYSPWSRNFDEMAKKTVLKKCLKYAPLKTEFVRAMNSDGTIKSTLAKDMVDVKDETDYIDTEAEAVTEQATPTSQPEPKEEPAVDMTTGEVLQEQPMSEDDRILEDSLNI
ncbi:recombinase RecT [Megasphaera stantonii]|uniref:recombinase RecT n=1 Tax=Megasphaera stantonii TaxID=2144175 RepID=UPI00195942BD|nr:recombinase RecT [Megasphaera stantonii]MBM6731818.1 recombinase RecT [Megasphaera stantonii]